jgi:hypothetical protein
MVFSSLFPLLFKQFVAFYLINGTFDSGILLEDFLSLAVFAFILISNAFAFSITSGAFLLHSLDHRSHLDNLLLNTSSLAGSACLDISTSLTITSFTISLSLDRDFDSLATVGFL